MPEPVTKEQAQAAAAQIVAIVTDTRDPNGADQADQIEAARDLQRLIDQTPAR